MRPLAGTSASFKRFLVRVGPMRLWVIAREDVLPALRRGKRLQNDRGRRPEYAWLCNQMRARIEGYCGPSIWWAWYKVEGTVGAKPDAQHCDLLHQYPPGMAMVCLEAQIPERDVLPSDYNLWAHICRYPDYLALDAEEAAAFRQHYVKPGNRVEMERVIHASWERIFTPTTWGQFDLTRMADMTRPGHNIQATFEELREADVVSATTFTSSRPGLLLLPGQKVAV